jgi:acetylornithine deacetylase/succinyl-diaminopimelate desuccinylase-like protein
VPALAGEAGFTPQECLGARPTLEVNGLLSGWTGEGAKTVLPARAMAKLSMRLVPDQDDRDAASQLRDYLTEHAPPTVRWELKQHAGGPAVLIDRDSPAMLAGRRALAETFDKEPVLVREGGSVPIVSLLKQKLGIDSVLMGFGLPDDRIHSPNEKLYLPNYYRGIEAFIRFFAAAAEA